MASEIHQLFQVNSLPTFLWKSPLFIINRVFMCCHWIKKPKLNDVCVLFKHLLLLQNDGYAFLKRPRFQKFSRNSHLIATSFFLLHLFQSYYHLLKILLKPCDSPDLNSLKLRGRRTERSFKAIIEKKGYEKVSANMWFLINQASCLTMNTYSSSFCCC